MSAIVVGVRSFVRRKVRWSYISKTVWPRITKLQKDTQADLLYVVTGYYVTSCFPFGCEMQLNTKVREMGPADPSVE